MAIRIVYIALIGYNTRVLKPYIVEKGVHIAVNRIKEIREAQGMTQTELAARAGVSQPYIHDLENNNRGARRETLERVANALGVTVDELTEKAG